MASKYPARARELPDQVPMGQAVHNLRGLREAMKGLRRRTAPGSGALRPEFLVVLGEKLEAHHMSLLEDWGMRYLQGELPPWFSKVWLSVETVPLYKTEEREGVRPIGMRNPLAKLLHMIVIKQNEAELIKFFEPQQIVMSKGGASKLVHSVRLMMEEEQLRREQGEVVEEELVTCKIDISNAFNYCSRASIVEALVKEPSLQHLAWTTACQLAPCHGLEARGERWGEGKEGSTQGDSAASAQYCASWHKHVRKLDAALAPAGMAKFGMDDGYCVGYPSILFPAMPRFAEAVLLHCNLHLNLSKCEIFCWSGELPADALPGMTLAGMEVDGEWESGCLVYGVPVGTDRYVAAMLDIKVEEIARKATTTCKVLEGEAQALWAVLRLSILQKFGSGESKS